QHILDCKGFSVEGAVPATPNCDMIVATEGVEGAIKDAGRFFCGAHRRAFQNCGVNLAGTGTVSKNADKYTSKYLHLEPAAFIKVHASVPTFAQHALGHLKTRR